MEGKKEKFLVQVLNEVKFGYDQPEIKAELEEHIYERSQWLLEKGMSAEDAEDEAVRIIGDPKELGKQLNMIHNQWVGLIWIYTTIIMFFTVAVAVVFGLQSIGPALAQRYEEIRDDAAGIGKLKYHVECDETLFLNDYSISFTDVYCQEYAGDSYILTIFYEHKGDAGKEFYKYLDEKTFLDENGNPYAKQTKDGNGLIFSAREKYAIMSMPDLSQDCIYIDYSIFGQEATGRIDLSFLFEKAGSE